jgi:hypothetical protein
VVQVILHEVCDDLKICLVELEGDNDELDDDLNLIWKIYFEGGMENKQVIDQNKKKNQKV